MNLLFIQTDNGKQDVEQPNADVNPGKVDTPVVTETVTEQTTTEDNVEKPEPTFMQTYGMWFLILGMIVVMYLFMWRPEQKRRKQMQEFRDNLKKGDKIITAGGIYGVIKEVDGASLLIEVDSNVTLRIAKEMVVADPTQPIQK